MSLRRTDFSELKVLTSQAREWFESGRTDVAILQLPSLYFRMSFLIILTAPDR